MILLTVAVVYFIEKGYQVYFQWKEWVLMLTGSLFVILSFIWDYLQHADKWGGLAKLWTISSQENLFTEVPRYIPQQFDWWIFWIGELLLLLAIAMFVKRTSSYPVKKPYKLTAPGSVSSANFADYLDGL
jgi:hypothetical protein